MPLVDVGWEQPPHDFEFAVRQPRLPCVVIGCDQAPPGFAGFFHSRLIRGNVICLCRNCQVVPAAGASAGGYGQFFRGCAL
jgi:hypothetical protein